MIKFKITPKVFNSVSTLNQQVFNTFNKVFNNLSFQQSKFSTISTFQHFQLFFNNATLKTHTEKTA